MPNIRGDPNSRGWEKTLKSNKGGQNKNKRSKFRDPLLKMKYKFVLFIPNISEFTDFLQEYTFVTEGSV